MWEAVDALTAEPVTDPVQKTIVRKVAEFVALVRGLSLARAEKGLYDLGLEIATRSGIIGAYRAENTPEATSALDNIEELLNSMQLFNEQREAEIRAGERQQEERATIEEWLQGVMLMTDMDKDDPQDRNKVTLMTVHSAKGLEYKFVYIVGLEENLFPSQRAVESPDGFEEERRLFYVALTRAKELATLSYARCVSSGAIWSSRVRAAFCARSTAVTWKRMRCRRSGNPSAARPGGERAPRRSTSCAAVSTTATSRSLRRVVRRPGRVSAEVRPPG